MPTANSVVERMLELAQVGPGDFVIDLGSGDGRINITAATKHGAKGAGIEIDPKLIDLAKANARAAGVEDKVQFLQRDLFEADLSRATIVTIYLLNKATRKLRPKLLAELKPGTRIVSHAAGMGEWKAEHFEMLEVKDKVRADAPKKTYLYLWIVPAQAAGTWHASITGASGPEIELTLSQQFQMLSGTARLLGKTVEIRQGRLRGESISVEFASPEARGSVVYRLTGKITGDGITGTAIMAEGERRRESAWQAKRVAIPAGETMQERGPAAR